VFKRKGLGQVRNGGGKITWGETIMTGTVASVTYLKEESSVATGQRDLIPSLERFHVATLYQWPNTETGRLQAPPYGPASLRQVLSAFGAFTTDSLCVA
jgi:hypothetical protein